MSFFSGEYFFTVLILVLTGALILGVLEMKPWDTYLDADTNTTMQDNLLLLASGDMSVDDFCKLIDDSIATNAKN